MPDSAFLRTRASMTIDCQQLITRTCLLDMLSLGPHNSALWVTKEQIRNVHTIGSCKFQLFQFISYFIPGSKCSHQTSTLADSWLCIRDNGLGNGWGILATKHSCISYDVSFCPLHSQFWKIFWKVLGLEFWAHFFFFEVFVVVVVVLVFVFFLMETSLWFCPLTTLQTNIFLSSCVSAGYTA